MSVRRTFAVVLAVLALLVLAGCNKDVLPTGGTGSDPEVGGTAEVTETPDPPTPVKLVTNVKQKNVPVDKVLEVSGKHGTLQQVTVTTKQGEKTGTLPGKLGADGTWTASTLLEAGTKYTVKARALRTDDNKVQRVNEVFTSADLTLDQQTYPSVVTDGGTYGVGMPVIVTFDIPVKNKAAFEKRMTVTSTPAQKGSWHWISDTEAHWRPKNFWKAGSHVAVDVDVNSVNAGNGIYGQEDRHAEFDIGDAHIYKVGIDTHEMQVFSNGKLLRTIPITTGMPGFDTRSGVKVIIEKFPVKEMNSETIGIDPHSANGYDIDDVRYAMRVTYSGEFIHAAPWSVGSQGYANVSHGCTGMSTDNAAWLYNMTQIGDVAIYSGNDKGMEYANGYADWNIPFKEYAKGSALH